MLHGQCIFLCSFQTATQNHHLIHVCNHLDMALNYPQFHISCRGTVHQDHPFNFVLLTDDSPGTTSSTNDPTAIAASRNAQLLAIRCSTLHSPFLIPIGFANFANVAVSILNSRTWTVGLKYKPGNYRATLKIARAKSVFLSDHQPSKLIKASAESALRP